MFALSSFKTSVKLSFFKIPTKTCQQLRFAVLRTVSIGLVGKVSLPPYTPRLYLLPNRQHLEDLWYGGVSLLWVCAGGTGPGIKLLVLSSRHNNNFQGFSTESAKWYLWQGQRPSYKGSRYNSPGLLLPFSLLALCMGLTTPTVRRGGKREGTHRQPPTPLLPLLCPGLLEASQASEG